MQKGGTCAFLMTDVAISVMVIAGFVEESPYYHWENVDLGVFIFALESAVRGGVLKCIKSSILAHSSLQYFPSGSPYFLS